MQNLALFNHQLVSTQWLRWPVTRCSSSSRTQKHHLVRRGCTLYEKLSKQSKEVKTAVSYLFANIWFLLHHHQYTLETDSINELCCGPDPCMKYFPVLEHRIGFCFYCFSRAFSVIYSWRNKFVWLLLHHFSEGHFNASVVFHRIVQKCFS